MKPLKLVFITLVFAEYACAFSLWNVKESGASGAGTVLDTASIQRAIDGCAEAGGGQVYFPPGHYLSGTVRLRSNVTLKLDAGARLIGTTNLSEYAQPAVPEFMPEARWGKWHRGLILAENVTNIVITGGGVIDGNKVFDPTGEERMRGPHTIVFVNCRGFTIKDLTIVDSANYAVFFQLSDDVEFRNVKFVGGWDGIHWRGAPERWCNNVNIIGCQFYTGDDAIAGRYWNNTIIQNCWINSSCNGIRLIGPATRLTITQNTFRGPGEQPHRTSREKMRTNMLSGVILQPGAWDRTRGLLDEVLVADNVMQNVASPVTLWTKPGNPVGRVTVSGLEAVGVYRSGLSAESWADAPITNAIFRNIRIEFAGGGKAWGEDQVVRGPGVDARPLPGWGMYARNVQNLVLEDVRFSLLEPDGRPVVFAEGVSALQMDKVAFPKPPEGVVPVFTNSALSRVESRR